MRRPQFPTPRLLMIECLGRSTCSGFTFGGIKGGDGGKGGDCPASAFAIFYYRERNKLKKWANYELRKHLKGLYTHKFQ